MPDMSNPSELEALQMLLNRGVVTQQQFDQSSPGVITNVANAVTPLSPHVQSRSKGKNKISSISMMPAAPVAIGIGL
jgi:hypothetical protein